jgi:hypothetical protein
LIKTQAPKGRQQAGFAGSLSFKAFVFYLSPIAFPKTSPRPIVSVEADLEVCGTSGRPRHGRLTVRRRDVAQVSKPASGPEARNRRQVWRTGKGEMVTDKSPRLSSFLFIFLFILSLSSVRGERGRAGRKRKRKDKE